MDDIFMRSEVLGRPEALVTVGLFTYKWSVCLWQVRPHVSLQMGFTKIRLGTRRAYKRALIAKISARQYETNRWALHGQYEIARALLDEKAWNRTCRSPQRCICICAEGSAGVFH